MPPARRRGTEPRPAMSAWPAPIRPLPPRRRQAIASPGARLPGEPSRGGRRAGWRQRRGPAGDLPVRRPDAAGPARVAPDGRCAGRRPRADPRPRQDADGGIPRRHARAAAARARARAVGERVAHRRDPGARGPRRRRAGRPATRCRRSHGAGRGRDLDRGDRRLDALRRAAPSTRRSGSRRVATAHDHDHGTDHEHAAEHPHDHEAGTRTTHEAGHPHDHADDHAQTIRIPTSIRITTAPANTITAASATATCRPPGRRSRGAASSCSAWPAA